MSTIEYQYQVLNITAVIGITALRKNRIGWLSQEINDWLELKIAQREE